MKYIATLLFISTFFCASAQDWVPATPHPGLNPNAPKEKWTDKLFTGGYFGLQFGSSQTYVEVSPMIGYKASKRFYPGLTIRYIYYQFKDPYSSYKYNTSIYGGSTFARFFVLPNLFLHAEYELLNMGVTDLYSNKIVRENITSIFLGGGYRQMMGARSGLDLMILWNLNDNINSPYVNPIIRMGFVFGI